MLLTASIGDWATFLPALIQLLESIDTQLFWPRTMDSAHFHRTWYRVVWRQCECLVVPLPSRSSRPRKNWNRNLAPGSCVRLIIEQFDSQGPGCWNRILMLIWLLLRRRAYS